MSPINIAKFSPDPSNPVAMRMRFVEFPPLAVEFDSIRTSFMRLLINRAGYQTKREEILRLIKALEEVVR